MIGINFNLVQIKLKAIEGLKTVNRFSGNEENYVFYYINLEESFENSCEIRTLIKIVKQYKDFENFNCLINNLHSNMGYREIQLPMPISMEETFIDQNVKDLWDDYLERIRMSPIIEENESFKEFFCLSHLSNNFQYHRENQVILDFTH